MPTNPNMIKIQTVTVGSGGAASIDFTNIPQTYTDLQIVLSGRQSSTGGTNVNMKFNGSSTSYINRDIISASGTVVSESTILGTSSIKIGFIPDNTNYTVSTFSNQLVYIPNYTSSNYKSVSTDSAMENNSTSVYFGLFAGLWSNTSAITSIALTCENGNFVQYSTATLYGLTSAGYSAKATGGMITADDTYWYHTFYSSGTFTPNQNVSADYLVVAGGGGGGSTYGDWGGGPGGGGGYRTFTGTTFANATNYSVVIGAGGTSTAGAGSTGGKGGTSSIIGGAISSSSTGGGGGGTTKENGGVQTNGQAGGSGGGAPQNTVAVSAGTGNQGGYSPVEGYAGGAVNGNPSYVAGQGGGASAVGLSNSAQSPVGIATTNGTSNSISGTSTVYSRGGYFIASNTGSLAGPVSSGWGGLSSGTNGANGAGGGGIVIIRYAK